MNKLSVCRGDVWFVDLNPTIGREQSKCRPCLVISADTFNKGPAELAVIVPITSKFRPLSWLVEITPPEGGLKTVSYVISNQLRTVSLRRFSGSCLGKIGTRTFREVEQRILFLLNL